MMSANDIPKTLLEAVKFFSDYENCRTFMVEARWPDGKVKCPLCGSDHVTYMENTRRWKCYGKHPRAQFTLKVGTIFEDSPIPLDKWLMAMWMVSNCKNGVSSYEIHRDLGVTQKTAWFLLHRIRLAMKNENVGKFGGNGPVEVDETFIGGNPKNMHRAKRLKLKKGIDAIQKPTVMGMLDRDARKVRAKVIPNVKRETLQNEINAQIEGKSTVYTDGWQGYCDLNTRDFIHETVTHMEEYVRGQVHTQGIENFWSLLKRGLRGTYVAVEPFHLDAYVDEQAFRYNNRATPDNPLNDADRFALVVSQIVGRRITYRELTGKVDARQF